MLGSGFGLRAELLESIDLPNVKISCVAIDQAGLVVLGWELVVLNETPIR